MRASVVATAEEIDDIKRLHTRKLALRELILALAKLPPREGTDMYERIVNDLAITCWAFDRWWVTATKKYGLQGKYEVNFETRELFPTQPDTE